MGRGQDEVGGWRDEERGWRCQERRKRPPNESNRLVGGRRMQEGCKNTQRVVGLVGCCIMWLGRGGGAKKATRQVKTTCRGCFEVVGDEMATQRVVITRWVCIEVVGDEGVHPWGKKQHLTSCKTHQVCAEGEEGEMGWRCGDKSRKDHPMSCLTRWGS